MSDITHDQQRQIIQTIHASHRLTPNEPGYVIPTHWLRKWKSFVGFNCKKTEESSPGSIDNRLLTNSSHSVDPSRKLGRDYEIVTKVEWDLYVKWYGGSPEVRVEIAYDPVKKINVPVIKAHLYKICFGGDEKALYVSNYIPVRDVIAKSAELFDLDKSKYHIRKFDTQKKGFILDENKIICEYFLEEGALLLLEPNDISIEVDISKSVSMPRILRPTSRSSRKSFSTADLSKLDYSNSVYPGLIGLINIGNTCYMATVLQCLFHVPLFIDLVNSSAWTDPPNDNKDGEVFKTFTDLFRCVWSPTEPVASPLALKTALEKHYPQFCGKDPHDSHEFLMCLLRHLHEEKIKKTSIRQSITVNAAYDADASWDLVKRLENSCFLDKFFGMIRCTLKCPVCQKVQCRFEPFIALSIPMPARNVITTPFVFVPKQPHEPMKTMKLKLFENTTAEEFAASLSLELKRDVDVAFAEVEVKSDKTVITWIPAYRPPKKKSDIYVYEISSRETLHAVVWLCLKVQKAFNKKRLEIGVPYLIPIKSENTTSAKMHDYCDRYFNYLFESSAKSNGSLAPEIKMLQSKVVDFNKPHDKRLKVKLDKSIRSKSMKFKPLEGTPYIAARNVYAIVNKKFMNNDFNWILLQRQLKRIATMPINRAIIPMMACISSLIEEEVLDPANSWVCSKCNRRVQAITKTSINRLPPILILHLKRFYIDAKTCTKNDTFVKYDTELDLSDYVEEQIKEDAKYRLVAVGEHSGTLTGGHYEAKVLQDGVWYNFSDNSVRECPESEVVNANGYILYYVRK